MQTNFDTGQLNNIVLLFSARENVLNSFKSRLFPVKNVDKMSTQERTKSETETEPGVATEPMPSPATEAIPTKHKKSK